MHTIFELLHPFPSSSSLPLLQTFISLKQSTIQSNAKSQTINPPRLLLESIIISNSNSKPSTNFSIRPFPFVLGAERSTTKKSGRRNILERKTISHLQFPVVNYRREGRKQIFRVEILLIPVDARERKLETREYLELDYHEADRTLINWLSRADKWTTYLE